MSRPRSELRVTVLSALGAFAFVAGCGSDDDVDSTDAGSPVADGPIADAQEPDAAQPDASIFPVTLEETGLYADFVGEVLAPGVQEYEPAWPLWSDGTTKRRWILLPEGETIDTTDMDFWVLPVDTKLWKEFTLDGQRMETRLLWKVGPNAADWHYMSFAWNAATTEANAVPDGVQDALGTTYDIPRERDCRTCHERQPDFALGFSAVQLAHQGTGVNLDTLIADSLLTVPPTGMSPYFAIPGTGDEQEVLGYLHGNCGGCHHPLSDVKDTTSLWLRMEVAKLATVEETTTYSTIVGVAPEINLSGATSLIEPGDINASAIYLRMANRGDNIQMPPKGSEIVDSDALATLQSWILGLP